MISYQKLLEKITCIGIPKYRAGQILHAICKEGKESYSCITTLPLDLQGILEHEIPILSIKPLHIGKTKDGGTIKALFNTVDGRKIESVLMHFKDGRNSVCVSSQVGCRLGCKFCATGTMKFGRDLTSEEIADQVLYFQQQLLKKNQHVTNVIYMGMGEPLMNYEEVIDSIKILNQKNGLNIGARNITVSTSGICENIDKLAVLPLQINLAVSLHAPSQQLREKIMPIARKYPLNQLMSAINHYINKTNRRVSYEYVMLKGINDGPEQAGQLVALIKDQLCHVNLIPYNATG
ncbi:23S rRNA (adenine(2503)-C(2))-methyltransferase RlmN, partial [Patescibacteria group bacterium]|nr:23S rRNA (adenine(2503)-C(2))-methyltransferase RlmN [Patescibacteria group bacterium]MBU1702976.1 23S rRNA (adenine(2503)-C(2))-methyltransferase RlmN [Patescibacteria group bacterium]MBU1954111.1 23S rRNA (adenine(2503)-C(2))-methyltransferase RlmN [Patescibacteria group bacterium]